MVKYVSASELLDKQQPEIKAKVIAAFEEGAEIIAAEAKSRVPVDTGKLRDSIHVEMSEDKTRAYIKANARNKKGFAYGLVIEFSASSGQPFLYPAADARAGEVKAKVREALKEALENV